MGELWNDLVDLLRQRPVLWLPVLVADLLGYLANLSRVGLLRALVLHQTTQHSVLDGAVVHTQMSASAMRSATIVALLLSWLVYFLRILLYSAAFVATAALVKSFRDRREKPAREIGPALGRHWGGLLELALPALAVYAVAALLFSWLTPLLTNHGQGALLRNGVFDYGVTLLVLLVLATVLPPVALRVMAGRGADRTTIRMGQIFALTLVFVASILAAFVNANSHQMARIAAGARYPLEIVGSLVAALPYVLLFTGMALLARRTAQVDEL